MITVLMLHHVTKTPSTCHNPGSEWLWYGGNKVDLSLLSLVTSLTYIPTQLQYPLLPPICGPWNKGADEQLLSADAILALSLMACMVTEKGAASPFKGSSAAAAYPQIPLLTISLCYIYYLHLDNILSDRWFTFFLLGCGDSEPTSLSKGVERLTSPSWLPFFRIHHIVLRIKGRIVLLAGHSVLVLARSILQLIHWCSV